MLITGPTGSGKSLTMAAVLDRINETKAYHIITIEDPVELMHRHKRSIIHQRELHSERQLRTRAESGAASGAKNNPGR